MKRSVLSIFTSAMLLITGHSFSQEPYSQSVHIEECNGNPTFKVLPEIMSILVLCNNGKYREAEKNLAELWNEWAAKERLTQDQKIALHFLSAYLYEKMGNTLFAEANITQVYLLQISHYYPPNETNE